MKKKISFKINNEKISVEVEPNDVLLNVIRDKIGITSPKEGCGRGDCGSCTILLDGKSVRSCLILAVEADGKEITTVEGLSKDELSDIQKSFLENNAFQCGFCTPGITMSATELLRKHPTPSIDEIKEHLSGNLCRCTGYTPIIDAILKVTKK